MQALKSSKTLQWVQFPPRLPGFYRIRLTLQLITRGLGPSWPSTKARGSRQNLQRSYLLMALQSCLIIPGGDYTLTRLLDIINDNCFIIQAPGLHFVFQADPFYPVFFFASLQRRWSYGFEKCISYLKIYILRSY